MRGKEDSVERVRVHFLGRGDAAIRQDVAADEKAALPGAIGARIAVAPARRVFVDAMFEAWRTDDAECSVVAGIDEDRPGVPEDVSGRLQCLGPARRLQGGGIDR